MTDPTQNPSATLSASPSTSLRWFVGVPVVTNPFMVLDVLTAALLAFGGGTLFVAAGQQVIGSGLSYPALMASMAYASYVAVALIACFLAFGIVVLGNRYVALFRFDDRGVYQEVMRGGTPVSSGGFFAYKPFAVEPIIPPSTSRPRTLVWGDVHGVQGVSALRIILLKGKRGGTAMKVYCPDEQTYQAALALVTARLG